MWILKMRQPSLMMRSWIPLMCIRDRIQIVTELMEEFNIFIDADDIEPENLNSLENIREMVERKLND